MMGLFDRKETELISEVIATLSANCLGTYSDFVPQAAVMRQAAGSEAGHVVSERNGGLVLIRGFVNDLVSHSPIVMGNVRAWLKYILDKLFDHEGRNFSKAFSDRFKRARSFELYCAGAAVFLD